MRRLLTEPLLHFLLAGAARALEDLNSPEIHLSGHTLTNFSGVQQMHAVWKEERRWRQRY